MRLGRFVFYSLCFISFFYGFLTYYPQLMRTDFSLWVFVPDCPLYVFVLLLVVVLRIDNWPLRLLAGAGLLKYGLWTLMIFLLYPAHYLAPGLFANTVILFFGHILMAASAFVIVPERPAPWMGAVAISWFLLNDFMDYWAGTVPVIPHEHMGFIMGASILLSVVSVVALYALNFLRSSRLIEWARGGMDVKQ